MSSVGQNTVLITGATGAIGSALAEQYADSGADLVLFGKDNERLDQLAHQCRMRGGQVTVRACNLLDLTDFVQQLDAICREKCPRLIIVNAGFSSTATGQGETWEAIDRVVRINLLAAMATVQTVVPHLREHGGGKIALISSLAAWYGLPITPAYSATKAALKNYGEALQGLLAKDGIMVSVVLPGFVESAMSRSVPGPKPFLLSADRAAALIIRGLAAGRARISFPFPLNLGCWFLAVLPPSLSGWLVKRSGYHG